MALVTQKDEHRFSAAVFTMTTQRVKPQVSAPAQIRTADARFRRTLDIVGYSFYSGL